VATATIRPVNESVGNPASSGTHVLQPRDRDRTLDQPSWVVSDGLPPCQREKEWRNNPELPTAGRRAVETQADLKPMPTVTPLVPMRTASARRFEVLQQWEGVIKEVGGDYILADLRDLTDPHAPMEEAEIYLDEISPADLPLLREGGVFYWTIGRERRKGGQICRVSEIRLRRLPKWSRRLLRLAERRAEAMLEQFKADAEGNPSEA
jgi:hypothetical protein